MSVTLVTFVNELEALSVTGVTRNYTQGQPATLNTADLPALWVDLPSTEAELNTSACDYQVVKTVNLVVALEPVAQNRRPTNFDAVLTMMDSVEAALKTYGAVSGSNRVIEWQSKLVFLTVNTIDYWAVSTTVVRKLT